MHGHSPTEGTVPDQEFRPLTDSLASCIRWRLRDYEAMLKAEVALVLGSCETWDEGGNDAAAGERSRRPRLQ